MLGALTSKTNIHKEFFNADERKRSVNIYSKTNNMRKKFLKYTTLTRFNPTFSLHSTFSGGLEKTAID